MYMAIDEFRITINHVHELFHIIFFAQSIGIVLIENIVELLNNISMFIPIPKESISIFNFKMNCHISFHSTIVKPYE